MKGLLRIVFYLCMIVIPVGAVGTVGYFATMQEIMSVYGKPEPSRSSVIVPEYDPHKPTVAVLLGSEVTEVFDFMTPYEMFAMTGGFNVFAVAPDRHVKSLTGGLDVMPHYTFEEMDGALGKSPDVIVIPYIPIMDKKKYEPVRNWIRKHASGNTTIMSICTGAENLADTGLLKGKSATSLWAEIGRLEKEYADTQWIRDRRYVLDGNLVTSAGLTSGIDAVLHVISQKLGEPAAHQTAEAMNYPFYHFVQHPEIEPFTIQASDAVFLLNNAFQWNKKKEGVLLYDGVEETALVSVFDTYSASGTATTLTVSSTEQPVVTKHGLTLVARHTMSDAPNVDELIVTGTEAEKLAAQDVGQWQASGNKAEVVYMHSEDPNRFAMEPPIERLAVQEDKQTAAFAQKRLEYRAEDLKLEGKPFPYESYGIPLLIIVLSILIAVYVDRRFIANKKAAKSM